ncbi:MAG: phosphoribosylanthranilate isomerase [Rickettsiales bacterium]|nr:phosphoribosylanthranilate isomerase [Rickettsiales bacterium]
MKAKNLNIKICGIKDFATAKHIEDLGVKFIGFVNYHKSPRNISMQDYAVIASKLNEDTNTVIVCVNPDDSYIAQLIEVYKPNYLQIHGDISLQRVRAIKEKFGLKLIIASSYSELTQLKIDKLEQFCEFILIDSVIQSGNTEYGGTGENFDWYKLKEFKFSKPYFLSGGLNINNVKDALDITSCEYIDLSSGLEVIKGIKSNEKITEFINYLKNNEYI